jgi:hypothetical protein
MTSSLVTNTLAVLAFMVAFYALLARERKTPYILNFLFPPAALLFISIILESVTQMVQAWVAWRNPNAKTPETTFSHFLLGTSSATHIGGVLLFYCGVIWITKNIWRLHNRQVNFRDDNAFRNLKAYRWARSVYRDFKSKPSYEHTPQSFDPAVLSAVLARNGFDVPPDTRVKTIASCGESLWTTDRLTVQIAAALLRQDWLVQYTTCDRHPVEWIESLQEVLGNEWITSVKRVAVVDGYTPHFGFTDSIHAKKSRKLTEDGVSYVATTESYAGVHSATAKAFNTFKTQAKDNVRKPTLLIYEGCRALADLESVEQYRIFLRHVITSERMWGSMVTLFVEPEADESNLKLIAAYADCLRLKQEEEVRCGE